MIKDNRPFSIENGAKDGSLITSKNIDDILQVSKWIKDNIRDADTVCPRNSYALKHLLEDDTHIYLTNNQFKDAMWLSGYHPENEDELNWRYKIHLVKENTDNPNPFVRWLISLPEDPSQRLCEGITPVFSQHVKYDPDFPCFADYDVILGYLEKEDASPTVIQAFEICWACYQNG